MNQFAYSISVDRKSTPQRTQQDTPNGESCFFSSKDFPQSRGVVEMLNEQDQPILIAATGNIREFVAQRLNENQQSSPKANLAPITHRIVIYPTGSAVESDWIVFERARGAQPDLYEKLRVQNRRALLILNPHLGIWRVEDTLSALPIQSQEVVLGPALTPKSAVMLGEALNDVFELCRYPKELAQAPNGKACAYKEMGRCPAACDGSEPIEAYYQRFNQALEACSKGIARWKSWVAQEIEDASSAMDFERASRLKRDHDQIAKLPTESPGLLGLMDCFRCLMISPSVRKGWAMLWIFGDQGLTPIAALNDESDPDQIVSRIGGHDLPMKLDQISLDRFSLLARHWLTKPAKAKRRRVTILDLRQQNWQSKLGSAIAQACIPSDPAQDDQEHTHIKSISRAKNTP